MQKLQIITRIALSRGYRTRAQKRQEETHPTRRRIRNYDTGLRNRLEIFEDTPPDIEDIEHLVANESLDDYEADLMDVAKSHKMHESEVLAQKQHLKTLIAKRQFFKNDDPNFLTFVEKEEIRRLHKMDPEEWTVEKLSQSFPALPETISQILKAQWKPKSEATVLKYDQKVKENWAKFRRGQCPVSLQLQEHLESFKHRKVVLTNRETIAKSLIEPKFEFPKPKSTLFSSIITTYEKEKSQDEGKEEKVEMISDKSLDLKETPKKKQLDGKAMTFDEFVTESMDEIEKMSPEVRHALMDTYKKKIAEREETKVVFESKSVWQSPAGSKKDVLVPESKVDAVAEASSLEAAVDSEKLWSLETRILERRPIEDESNDYLLIIKIPKAKLAKGKTYRFKDCYYDDDGTFLYRVPGLRG